MPLAEPAISAASTRCPGRSCGWDIADEMTATGWRVIEEAISDLGLTTRSDASGEASGAKKRD
jgi:hypothetical protein